MPLVQKKRVFMAQLHDIVFFLDALLEIDTVKDDSWNGLQVEGKKDVSKVVFAVDAGMETFEWALREEADMVVVHHGLFWRSANPSVQGWNLERVNFLLKHGISVYASHLPLDKHPEVGNNAQLLKILGYKQTEEFGRYGGQTISFLGKRDEARTVAEIGQILETEIGAKCRILPFGSEKVSRLAICSGGGASFSFFWEAINVGADLYITGDATEMYHTAKDAGMNVIFAGHHATETVGVKALSSLLREKFDVETAFIDIPTGL